MKSETHRILKRILDDIRVEMTDEFDQNFERQSFFGEAWQRHKSPTRQGYTCRYRTTPQEHPEPDNGEQHYLLYERTLCCHSQ